MNETTTNSIDITPAPAMRGKTKLTVKLGDELIAVDEVNINKAKDRDTFIKKLVKDKPGLNDLRDDIEDRLKQIAVKQAEPAPTNSIDAERTSDELLAAMPDDIKSEAEAMLNAPDLMKRIVADVHRLGVAGEDDLIETVYLIGTSRLLPKPMAAIVQGGSSTGKSYVGDQVGRLFPDETILLAHQMTPQALYHLPEGDLQHKFVLAGERNRKQDDDTAQATKALREMLGSGYLRKLMPVKANGGIETVEIKQDGPIAYIESTTLSKVFDEDQNRCLLLHTDEQPEQTRRILTAAATGYANGAQDRDRQRIIDRHHAIQRMIQQADVVVPYAERLAESFSDERVEARRAFPLFVAGIRAIALLHQRQRERDDQGRIIATLDDYATGRHLLGEAVERSLGLIVSKPARRFFIRNAVTMSAGTFTTNDLLQVESASKSSVYGWLSELADAAWIEVVERGQGKTPTVWKVANGITPGRDNSPVPMLPLPAAITKKGTSHD